MPLWVPGLGEEPHGSPLMAINDCRANPFLNLTRKYELENCAFVNAYVAECKSTNEKAS